MGMCIFSMIDASSFFETTLPNWNKIFKLILQAFIYIGIYGYPFFQAGKKVMTLFNQRGWSVVINDHLIRNALGLVSIAIAFLSVVISSLLTPSSELTGGFGTFM